MTFSLLLRGVERTFTIELLNGRSTSIAKYSESSVVEIRNEISEQSLCRLEVVDIAGMDQALEKLNKFLSKFDRKFRHTAPKSCAVLLHGGPGTGKTFLLDKIAHTGWGKVYKIKKNMKHATIQTTFQDAKRSQPSLIVIDDLESLISNEDPKTRDISESLGEELDNLLLSQPANTLPRVLVIASTQEAGRIPISLKKRGRFNRQILLPLPDAAARREILKSLDFALPKSLLDETLDKLGDVTHAYSAGDLVLLQDAANEFFEDRAEENKWDGTEEECHLSQDDIEHALLSVRPTAMHDITLQPPKVKWEDIGGQEIVKSELREAVEAPLLVSLYTFFAFRVTHLLQYPLLVERAGALPTKGILMYGPPGCSKTLIAQAMATEAGFNFFAVKGAELLNMYVGESERQVREIFSRARAARPSIIFFDEVESIGGKREGHGNPGVNVLTTLLNEMDGIETLKGVMVLAATNKPQALDLALLRPGRFDELLYVSPPDFPSRKEILNIRTKRMAIADDVDINELARLTDGYSGAELVSVCSQASKSVVRKSKNMKLEDVFVRMEDLLDAMKKVKKQITPELVRSYEQWAAGVSQATN